MENKINLILFYPTLRCNLQCPYCYLRLKDNYFSNSFETVQIIGQERKWYEWLSALERFRPYFLEITGGEPLMYTDFKTLIAHLPTDAKWAITSNTLLNIENIDLSKCISWTASFHKSAEKQERFLINIQKLTAYGLRPSVTIVAQPGKFEQCAEDALFFAKRHFRINILRELNKDVDWRCADWDKFIELRKLNYNVLEFAPPTFEFPKGFICEAGINYFCLFPDGQVFRCFTAAMKAQSLGFIENFEPFREPKDCFLPCGLCDKDVIVKKIKI